VAARGNAVAGACGPHPVPPIHAASTARCPAAGKTSVRSPGPSSAARHGPCDAPAR
jgi:hypothetical protein